MTDKTPPISSLCFPKRKRKLAVSCDAVPSSRNYTHTHTCTLSLSPLSQSYLVPLAAPLSQSKAREREGREAPRHVGGWMGGKGGGGGEGYIYTYTRVPLPPSLSLPLVCCHCDQKPTFICVCAGAVSILPAKAAASLSLPCFKSV